MQHVTPSMCCNFLVVASCVHAHTKFLILSSHCKQKQMSDGVWSTTPSFHSLCESKALCNLSAMKLATVAVIFHFLSLLQTQLQCYLFRSLLQSNKIEHCFNSFLWIALHVSCLSCFVWWSHTKHSVQALGWNGETQKCNAFCKNWHFSVVEMLQQSCTCVLKEICCRCSKPFGCSNNTTLKNFVWRCHTKLSMLCLWHLMIQFALWLNDCQILWFNLFVMSNQTFGWWTDTEVDEPCIEGLQTNLWIQTTRKWTTMVQFPTLVFANSQCCSNDDCTWSLCFKNWQFEVLCLNHLPRCASRVWAVQFSVVILHLIDMCRGLRNTLDFLLFPSVAVHLTPSWICNLIVWQNLLNFVVFEVVRSFSLIPLMSWANDQLEALCHWVVFAFCCHKQTCVNMIVSVHFHCVFWNMKKWWHFASNAIDSKHVVCSTSLSFLIGFSMQKSRFGNWLLLFFLARLGMNLDDQDAIQFKNIQILTKISIVPQRTTCTKEQVHKISSASSCAPNDKSMKKSSACFCAQLKLTWRWMNQTKCSIFANRPSLQCTFHISFVILHPHQQTFFWHCSSWNCFDCCCIVPSICSDVSHLMSCDRVSCGCHQTWQPFVLQFARIQSFSVSNFCDAFSGHAAVDKGFLLLCFDECDNQEFHSFGLWTMRTTSSCILCELEPNCFECCIAPQATCIVNCLRIKITSSEWTETKWNIWESFGSRPLGAILSLLGWTMLQFCVKNRHANHWLVVQLGTSVLWQQLAPCDPEQKAFSSLTMFQKDAAAGLCRPSSCDNGSLRSWATFFSTCEQHDQWQPFPQHWRASVLHVNSGWMRTACMPFLGIALSCIGSSSRFGAWLPQRVSTCTWHLHCWDIAQCWMSGKKQKSQKTEDKWGIPTILLCTFPTMRKMEMTFPRLGELEAKCEKCNSQSELKWQDGRKSHFCFFPVRKVLQWVKHDMHETTSAPLLQNATPSSFFGVSASSERGNWWILGIHCATNRQTMCAILNAVRGLPAAAVSYHKQKQLRVRSLSEKGVSKTFKPKFPNIWPWCGGF